MTMMLDEYMGWGDDVEIERITINNKYDKKYYFKLSGKQKSNENQKPIQFTGFWGSIVTTDVLNIPEPPKPPTPPSSRRIGGTIFFE